MRRRILIVLPVLALGAAVVLVARRDTGSPAAVVTPVAATATVEKRTLTRTQRVTGTLGHGDEAPVMAGGQGAGRQGMVTWLPDEGSVIGRGGTVYRVDQRPVPLLYGTIPIYRTLKVGSRGDDVRQLEQNLAALGYTGFTVDAVYSDATAAAVKRWHRTGVVEPGDAVVAPGERRIGQVAGVVGAPAAGVLLQWTGTAAVVEVTLNPDNADLIRPGAPATVELPNGTKVAARVARIGAKAAYLTLIKAEKSVGKVGVDVAADTRRDVLAVPVTALVARPGGGYALVTGDGDRAVRTGLFADGYVEVSGPGIEAGLTVQVPR